MSQATADPRLTAVRTAPRRRMRLSWSDPVFRCGRLADRHPRPRRRHRLVFHQQHRRQPRRPPHRHRLRLPRPRRRHPHRRVADPLQPRGGHLRQGAADRRPEHPASRRHRHHPRHHPRHPDRHRPPVEKLAAGQADRLLRRNPPRHPAAAATAVLVHHPPRPPRPETSLAPRHPRLPLQPRHEAPRTRLAARPHLGPARLHRRPHRHRPVEPPTPAANRKPPASAPPSGPSPWPC